MKEERKKFWIDNFQTNLSIRIAGYLFIFFVVFCNCLFAWRMLAEGPIDPWQQFVDTLRVHLPVFICLLALVPVMAVDIIRFSHRLVGPLVRFRQTIQAISRGEAVRPIKLRADDYLTELRDDFNRMLEELQKKGVPVLKPANPVEEESQQQTA